MSNVRCHLLAAACAAVCCSGTRAQNLVPNASFEVHSNCPSSLSQFQYCTTWFQPTLGTSDYYNVCGTSPASVPVNYAGTQMPLSGDAYAAVRVWDINPNASTWREYVEAPLTNALVASQQYRVSFHVSLGDLSMYAVDSIGAYLCNGPLVNMSISNALPVVPQVTNPAGTFLSDKVNWMLVTGTFVAAGGEDHIIIGNFLDNLSTPSVLLPTGFTAMSYMLIDDVSVEAVPAPGAAALLITWCVGAGKRHRPRGMTNSGR